jgi:MHS family proline/betaine transporter-like MFS transporter
MGQLQDPINRRRLVIAGTAGNIVEWYDFAVYGYFAQVIGKHFFSSENPATSLIASFGAFAAGFLMRPIGGMIFGHIGDKIGRKAALTLSVLAMAVPTFLIGILPDYSQLGATASVLLVVLRMVQGLSVGGECTTSVVFLVEGSPPDQRGYQ